MSQAVSITVPLRWGKTDAKRLYQRALFFEANGAGQEDLSLWVAAAKAANEAEPLLLECADRDELEQVVEGFGKWGVRPSIG